jgi:enterobacteria phage integrase
MTRRINLPYLWAAKGRGGKLYYFYRRDGLLIPIKSPEGRRLKPGDVEFYEAYAAIHARFGTQKAEGPKIGTIAHLVQEYRQSGDFQINIGRTTRSYYERYLTIIVETHGEGLVRTLPREAILKMRDEYKNTPAKANMLLLVFSILLHFAEERPLTFRLPVGWRNPAEKIKKLKIGEGYRPWAEIEIDQFRDKWPIGTLERTIFEAFLNTGQRGIDVASMKRRHYYNGELSVYQIKTGKRVWIPAIADFKAAIDPWLRSHNYPEIFRTPSGRKPLTDAYMRAIMRAAFEKAGLPKDCVPHGLRYTFATRAIELGLDWQEIESIIGHETAAMAAKYTKQRRDARLTTDTMNRALSNRRLRFDEGEMPP